ncbi:MAG: homoserine dehydrogenase [Hyphomicrobiales bacterium]|nr:homoserine dehydrogenase [Hyphomicrobiales bacterium]
MADVLRIGIAGLGTVGTSVVRLLRRHADSMRKSCGRSIEVTAVSARDRNRDRHIDLEGLDWYDDPVAMAADAEIDIFVELIGGADGPAKESVEKAIARGLPVVTANKALLAKHGMDLARKAEASGAAIGYEAAVAGGIPVIKTLREALAGNQISRVYGILNGTCNYILSQMELEGAAFDTCLAEAQRLGYAEADPTFDIGGFDVAHKLTIIAALAFGVEVCPDCVHVEGIESITLADLKAADELGYRIKLLGVAQRTPKGIEQRVHPTMVPKGSAIAQVMGVTNAVTIDADAVGELTLIGPGAGGDATASAVISDIADMAKGNRNAVFGKQTKDFVPADTPAMQAHEGGYYVRLGLHDRPGAAAAIAARLAEQNISLESIVQKAPRGERSSSATGNPVPVVLQTYATSEANIRAALDSAIGDGYIVGKPQVIRIERE